MAYVTSVVNASGTVIDAETLVHLASLPPVKIRNIEGWSPSRISPCPALMLCCGCSQYRAISDFYPLRSNKTARADILGGRRSHTCNTCATQVYANLDPRKKLYYAARQRARLRGHEFTITLDNVVIPTHCPMLGIPLYPTSGQAAHANSPTLDRLDSRKGYTPANTVVISHRANTIKNNATPQELRLIADYTEKALANVRGTTD
jgi:hypothetical protein